MSAPAPEYDIEGVDYMREGRMPSAPLVPVTRQSWLMAQWRSFVWDYRFYRGSHPAVFALHMAWREARKPLPF